MSKRHNNEPRIETGEFDPGQPPRNYTWSGDTFDYRLFEGDSDTTQEEFLKLLAVVGMEGWEMCGTLATSAGGTLLIFKRRRPAGLEVRRSLRLSSN